MSEIDSPSVVNPLHTPAPVLDIVSFGYKNAFKLLWPLTRLTLPLMLALAITQGFLISAMVQVGATPKSLQALVPAMAYLVVFLVVAVLNNYNHYIILRYINDAYHDQVSERLWTYWLPKKSLLGLIGLYLLIVLAMIPISIVGLIGLLFLIAPGLAVFTLSAVVSGLIIVRYMAHPKEGVIGAFSRVFKLLDGQLWRAVGLGLAALFIYMIVSAPVSIFNEIVKLVAQVVPHLLQNSVWVVVAYAACMLALIWFSMNVGYSGLMLIYYRFHSDLQARYDEKHAFLAGDDDPLAVRWR